MATWRQVLILFLLAGLGYGGFVGYRHFMGAKDASGAPAPARIVTVETAPIQAMTLARTVEAVGTTRALRSVEIRPLASGRIVELAIRPGAQVEAGAALARLDDEIQRADIAEAEALLEEQRQAADRAERLRATNAISSSALEQAHARLAVARAVFQRAERRLEDRTIRAPFDGQVGLTDADLGAQVDQSDVLTRLDDLTEVEIEFSLPETLFAEIARGMTVSAVSAAYPGRSFAGAVSEIDSRIDPIGRSFRVRATIPNPEGELPAGMFMSLSLTLSSNESLVAPEEAIVAQAANTFVFVVEGGAAVRRPVRTGMRKDGAIAILSGVEAGEQVVTRGLQSVRDGAAVNVLDSAAGDEGAPKS